MQIEMAQLLAAAIETPRLTLEPLRGAHAEAFFEALQQDAALYQWISMPKPESLAALREHWLDLEERRRSPDGLYAWPIWAVRRKSDGAYLGRVDAEVSTQLSADNLGFYVFSKYWGQGYASEAAGAAVHALAARGVSRFVATVTVGNTASGRVLQKLGFEFSRILPGNDVIRGEPMDDEEYVLSLAPERSALRA